jgi:hypothetical protein
VLTRLRDLGDYEAALLMKAKIEACLAAVVTEEGDEALDRHGGEPAARRPGPCGRSLRARHDPRSPRASGSVEVVNPVERRQPCRLRPRVPWRPPRSAPA